MLNDGSEKDRTGFSLCVQDPPKRDLSWSDLVPLGKLSTVCISAAGLSIGGKPVVEVQTSAYTLVLIVRPSVQTFHRDP